MKLGGYQGARPVDGGSPTIVLNEFTHNGMVAFYT